MSTQYCDYCHELADLFHPGEHNAGDVLEQLGGVEQIMAKLGTNPKDGIDPDKDAIAQRKKEYANTLPTGPSSLSAIKRYQA